MGFPKNVWQQLKGLSADELISALLKDGFCYDRCLKTERMYRHPDGRKACIHYHTGNTCYGQKLLTGLLDDIGWTEKDMRRLKLIK